MPISFPSRNRCASSISLQTVMPFDRASSRNASSAGTPGLGIIKSCARNVFPVCPPNSNLTPAARNLAGTSPNSLSARVSVAVTIALCPAQKSAVATPVRASPTTSTRFFRSSIEPGIFLTPSLFRASSAQFQSRQRKQRKHQRRNPEPHNHFALAPSQQFEMVMNRSHAENAFPAHLERPHLQNHRERFQHEHPADKHQQHFLL